MAAYASAYRSAMEAYAAEGRLRSLHAIWVAQSPYLRHEMDEDTGLISITPRTAREHQQRRRIVQDVHSHSQDDPVLRALWVAPLAGCDFDAAFALCIGAMTQGGEYDETDFLMSSTGDWRPGSKRPSTDGYRRQTVGISRLKDKCTVVEMLVDRSPAAPRNFWKRRRS